MMIGSCGSKRGGVAIRLVGVAYSYPFEQVSIRYKEGKNNLASLYTQI